MREVPRREVGRSVLDVCRLTVIARQEVFRTGVNFIDGIAVVVERKRIRRINLHIGRDGRVHLSVPFWGATIADGEKFLKSKWKWVVETRAQVLKRSLAMARDPITPERRMEIAGLLGELHACWSARLGEAGVTWGLRAMKTLWGSCNWRKRHVTYNLDLARVPRELVEYVVVHELTHLRVPNHGTGFQSLMDDRMPDWRLRRRMLRLRTTA